MPPLPGANQKRGRREYQVSDTICERQLQNSELFFAFFILARTFFSQIHLISLMFLSHQIRINHCQIGTSCFFGDSLTRCGESTVPSLSLELSHTALYCPTAAWRGGRRERGHSELAHYQGQPVLVTHTQSESLRSLLLSS